MSGTIFQFHAIHDLPPWMMEVLSEYLSIWLQGANTAILDAGVPGQKDETPVFKCSTKSGQRIPLEIIFNTFRLNLFDSLLVEIDAADPLKLPRNILMVGFVITTGW